jgi:lauroyl/myristoyl acyltransferase
MEGVNVSLVDVSQGMTALRRLITVLRRGGAALLLPDGDLRQLKNRSSLELALGNRTVRVPTGAARLAIEASCTIVPVHIEPFEVGHRVVLGRPISSEPDGTSWQDVQCALDHLVRQTILVHPGQWDGWPLLSL